jgi:hypothetical protein
MVTPARRSCSLKAYAFLDKAEPRLAAIRATGQGADMIDGAPSDLARFHAVEP